MAVSNASLASMAQANVLAEAEYGCGMYKLLLGFLFCQTNRQKNICQLYSEMKDEVPISLLHI